MQLDATKLCTNILGEQIAPLKAAIVAASSA